MTIGLKPQCDYRCWDGATKSICNIECSESFFFFIFGRMYCVAQRHCRKPNDSFNRNVYERFLANAKTNTFTCEECEHSKEKFTRRFDTMLICLCCVAFSECRKKKCAQLRGNVGGKKITNWTVPRGVLIVEFDIQYIFLYYEIETEWFQIRWMSRFFF